jgi:putative restriction endonuclease
MATKVTERSNWTRQQTLAALHIYLQLTFGQLYARQPKIIQLAKWIDRTPGSVALKLCNFASLDPQVIITGRKGMGNVSAQDRKIWDELQADWDNVALEAAAEYERLASNHGVVADVDLLEAPFLEDGRTRSATIQVRVNQARFRRAVLASYNTTCCISGLRHEKLVIASHIVPWSEDARNRLNPQNGLCLSALHDKAFDQGLITVMPDLRVRVSTKLKAYEDDVFIRASLLKFDGKPIKMPGRFRPSAEFLAHHNRRFGFAP